MLKDLTPQELHDHLAAGAITLIDVREPREYAAERIHGALLYPLSTFDPKNLPSEEGKPIVFHCGTGKRSGMAAEKYLVARPGEAAHLAGGIKAWKEAGLPTIEIDPETGQIIDRT